MMQHFSLGEILVICVGIVNLYFVFSHPQMLIYFVPIIWLGRKLHRKKLDAKKAEQDQEADRERLRQAEIAKSNALKAQQQTYSAELVKLSDTSFSLFESLPAHLLNAEELLCQSENDFKENAFAPFWNSIEQATMRLGDFDDHVRIIAENSNKHTELLKVYKGLPPRFPVVLESVRGMVAAQTTVDRMKGIVRKAQCDFQFATIYEQRKTNHLLVAGFTNLAQVLDGMGRRIASSIDNLSVGISAMSSTMQESFSTLGEQLQTANQEVVKSVEGLHSTTRQSVSDWKDRHNRTLEMLDNIQHRRIPYPRTPFDQAY